jgi:nitrogen fixation-related uncharacterized protein
MSDMEAAIKPKSDQLNADDLISGPRTITITAVNVRPGAEQPVSVRFEGDNGKPWRPCKSMCRVMVMAWGADSSQYAGQSVTLFRDPRVTWGGMEVGGIRISAMTGIDRDLSAVLTKSKSKREMVTIKRLTKPTKPAAYSPPSGTVTGGVAYRIGPTQYDDLSEWLARAQNIMAGQHAERFLTDHADLLDAMAAGDEFEQQAARQIREMGQ